MEARHAGPGNAIPPSAGRDLLARPRAGRRNNGKRFTTGPSPRFGFDLMLHNDLQHSIGYALDRRPWIVKVLRNMCKCCQTFAVSVPIKKPEELEALHERLFFDGVKSGVLEIVDGSLQWSDHIDCTLRCLFCKQQFRLSCETYHVSGGQFGPAA